MGNLTTRPAFPENGNPLELLVALSRFYGADPEFVKAGGGNTSVKAGNRLHIKASGVFLGTIDASGFVELDRQQLAAVLETDFGDDLPACETRFKQAILAACVTAAKAPSIETILHDQLPGRFVVHSHPTLINMVNCCQQGEALTQELFGDEVAWMPYADPGIARAQMMRRALQEYTRRTGRVTPRAVMMQNHGPMIQGETPEEVCEITDWLVEKIAARLAAVPEEAPFGPISPLAPAEAQARRELFEQALHCVLADYQPARTILHDDSEAIRQLVCAAQGEAYAQLGPQTPHQIVLCQSSFPLWFALDSSWTVATCAEKLEQAIALHQATHKLFPTIYLVPGTGLFAAGEDLADAATIRDFYADAIQILAGSQRLGGIRVLNPQERIFIESWEMAGSYRPPSRQPGTPRA